MVKICQFNVDSHTSRRFDGVYMPGGALESYLWNNRSDGVYANKLAIDPLQLETCNEAVSGVSIFSKGKIIIFDDRLRGVLQSLEPLTVSGTKRSTFSSTRGKPHRLRLFDGYSVTGGELLQLIE